MRPWQGQRRFQDNGACHHRVKRAMQAGGGGGGFLSSMCASPKESFFTLWSVYAAGDHTLDWSHA